MLKINEKAYLICAKVFYHENGEGKSLKTESVLIRENVHK